MTGTLNNSTPDRDQGPKYGARIRTVTASATLTNADDGKTIVINAAAGLTLTLPTSTGTGWKARFMVKTTVTSNSVIIKVANATDELTGNVLVAADGGATVVGWEAADNDDTITLNGSTTGGIFGDCLEIEDLESGRFLVRAVLSGTGTEATPFSATV